MDGSRGASSRRSGLGRVLFLLVLVVGLFGCDHATKMAAKTTLERAAPMVLAPDMFHGALELRYAENPDIAFSALSALGIPHSSGVLIALSVLALGGLSAMALLLFRRARRDSAASTTESATDVASSRTAQIGFALALGGGLGNLVDRFVRGVVIDFIHVKGWPIFNVADIAIVIGMVLIALGWRSVQPAEQACER